MQIHFDNKEDLNALLSITLEPNDYTPALQKELNKLKNTAQIKGFRKGKVPTAMLRKMYGQSVLLDVVNKILKDEIDTYLKNEKIDVLGYPMPSEDQEIYDFSSENLQTYTFKFDVGILPEFDIKGADSSASYERFKVIIGEEMIDHEIEQLLKRAGNHFHPDKVEAGDIIKMEASELEGDDLKDEGANATFTFMVDRVTNDETKAAFLAASKGDILRFNIHDLGEKDEQAVRRYLLQLPEEDGSTFNDMFEGKIIQLTRHQNAEMNQEFFDKVFGPDAVTDEAGFRSKLQEALSSRYEGREDALLFRDLQEGLLSANNFPLPETFLKKWLAEQDPQSRSLSNDEAFESYKRGIRWTVLRERIALAHNIEVSQTDIRNLVEDKILGYMGGQNIDDAFVTQTANKLMSDEKFIREQFDEIMTDKVFLAIKDAVTIIEKPIQEAAFLATLEDAKQKTKAQEALEDPEMAEVNSHVDDAEIED